MWHSMRKLYINYYQNTCLLWKCVLCFFYACCAIHHKHVRFSNDVSLQPLQSKWIWSRAKSRFVSRLYWLMLSSFSTCHCVCVLGWVGGAVTVYVLPVKITNDFLTVSFIDRRFCWGSTGIFVVSSLLFLHKHAPTRPLSAASLHQHSAVCECV